LKPFSRGGAKLAVSAKTPVLPVIHNAGYCWPAHTILKKPGTIHVRFGKLIGVEGKDSTEVTDAFGEWVRDNMDVINDDVHKLI
jgi:1-acyl-sn-glycerol-3-phosphate acyltransferase